MFISLLMLTIDDGQTKHELPDEGSKLTLICKSSGMSEHTLHYSRDGVPAMELTFEVATYHADRVNQLHARTLGEVKKIFPNFEWPKPRPWADGVRFIVGLIDMTFKLVDVGAANLVVWKYPEAFLHPAEAANLADVMIHISDYARNKPSNEQENGEIPKE